MEELKVKVRMRSAQYETLTILVPEIERNPKGTLKEYLAKFAKAMGYSTNEVQEWWRSRLVTLLRNRHRQKRRDSKET